MKDAVLYFEGFLKIPADGEYTFALTAMQKALLRIHNATVIDADYGYSAGSEKTGTLKLKEGLHPFRLYYMGSEKEKPFLDLEWSGPQIEKQLIPSSCFFNN